MSRYDNDEAVVALLRDAVPPVPEVADRITSIRVRAGRQRAMVWTQALGAVASVLLIVGVAAAVGTAGGRETGPVAPVDDPIATGIKALGSVKSLRFEATVTPTGNPTAPADAHITDEQLRAMLTANVTGVAERDGDLQIDGDLSPVMLFGVEEPGEFDVHFRVVDGQSYRSVMPGEVAPEGKTWVAEPGDTQTSGDDLTRWLRLGAAFADDVKYTGPGVVRGEPVAEYEFTVARRTTRFADVLVTFALDGEGRLRRIAAEFPWTGIFVAMSGDSEGLEGADDSTVRFELLVYDFDEPVTVSRPPAAKTATEEDMERMEDARSGAIQQCFEDAGNDHEAAEKCFDGKRTSIDGLEDCTTETKPDGTWTSTCGNTTSIGGVGDAGVSGWTEYPPGVSVMTPVPASPSP